MSPNVDVRSRVADAAVRSYELGGATTHPIDFSDHAPLADEMACFLVEDLQRLECVLPVENGPEKYRDLLVHATNTNRDVWVVVPIRLLGRSHEVMRGLPLHLQGWWEAEGGRICFTAPEVP